MTLDGPIQGLSIVSLFRWAQMATHLTSNQGLASLIPTRPKKVCVGIDIQLCVKK